MSLKVLYISDSLGTPIHPRGIFNFSLSLVEILKTIGAEVHLVVEGNSGFGLEGRYGGFAGGAPDAVNTLRLAEVHRYFSFGKFAFRWNFQSRHYRMMFAASRPLLRAWIAIREFMGASKGVYVKNDAEQLDFVPDKSQHLNAFDALLVKRGFYAASMSRANLNMAPVPLDARGYDLAVVDTPHFLKIDGLPSERILTVVHDLIPLRDPTMDAEWRYLFVRKLEATLKLKGNMVFVSRYTQRVFHAAFPNHEAPREFIFYPAIRRKMFEDAARASIDATPMTSASDASLPQRDLTRASADDGSRPAKRKKRRSSYGGNAIPPGYDPALPYFVTATSDEPRKNIAAIVRAFYQLLRGRANIVVLGEVNSGRYDPGPDANVHFPGYVTDAEKIAYFEHASGVVFASLSEGFGIPLIEGAVMGIPVLCSDIEVFREVAGDDAFYFDPRDSASLAQAVVEALGDPIAAQQRAEALRQSAISRFSQEAVGARVRAAIAELGLAEG